MVSSMATSLRSRRNRRSGLESSCRAPSTCTSTSRRRPTRRRIDDVTLAHRFAELGLAGFALKSHYTSTAERRASSRASCPQVLGAVAMNQALGG